MNKFDNIERRRYYGLRIGDTVKLLHHPMPNTIATVSEYGFMDNNAVYVKINGEDDSIKWTAEHCEIITRVEDK